jgi:hypothetical protein
MTTCQRCGWVYPDELLSDLVGTSPATGRFRWHLCAICALEVTNEQLGLRNKAFGGEMAEAMRQDALAWRKEHPRPRGPRKQA